jgi:hypothetical protein
MAKIDFKKRMADLYAPGGRVVTTVDVPEMNFVMIDGKGSPDASTYQEAVEALYSISYTLKFMVKKTTGTDYGVMPLEGLWWADNMMDFAEHNKSNWQWTALIMQPEYVTDELFRAAIDKLKVTKNPPGLARARFQKFHEGICAQIMYMGPYSGEGPVIRRIHEFIHANAYVLRGKHHEIYLGDPRRTQPDKLKTILRQPMEKTSVLEQGFNQPGRTKPSLDNIRTNVLK